MEQAEVLHDKINPDGFVELRNVTDTTEDLLKREKLGLFGQMFEASPKEVYELVHGNKPKQTSTTIALLPTVQGTEKSLPSSIFRPGLQINHPAATPNLPRFDSRSAFLRDNRTYVKGVGIRSVQPKSNEQNPNSSYSRRGNSSGWEILGGVDRGKAELELLNSNYLAYCYKILFPSQSPPVRIASNVLDISNALLQFGDGQPDNKQIYQVIFKDLDHRVRSIYSHFLTDPSILASDIDLKSREGQQELIDRWNRIQSDWILEYFQDHTDETQAVIPVNIDDFRTIKHETGETLFDLLQKQIKLIEGSYTPLQQIINAVAEKIGVATPILDGYSKDELLSQRAIIISIKNLANRISHTFFERNKYLAEKTINWQASRLGNMIGMAYGMGWELGSAVSPKDAYGGKVADLDVTVQFPEDPFSNSFDSYKDTMYHAGRNLHDIALMYGLDPKTNQGDREILATFQDTFIQSLCSSYSRTLQSLDSLGITDPYRAALIDYQQKLITRQEPIDPWNMSGSLRQQLPMMAPEYFKRTFPEEYSEYQRRTPQFTPPNLLQL